MDTIITNQVENIMGKKRIGTAVISICICALFLIVAIMSIVLLRFQEKLSEFGTEKENVFLQCQDLQEKVKMLQERNSNLETQIGQIIESQKQQEQDVYQETFTESITPGQILTYEDVSENLDAYFSSRQIQTGDEIYSRIYGKSYQENENIALSDLRYLTLLHYNFNHEIQVGEMIVNASIEQDVLGIFKELFANEYEIQSIFLIDNYWTGDADSTDSASIEANNTSCFNYRPVTGGSHLSNHAYGCAIDINPQQNPYIWMTDNGWGWSHDNATPYVDRSSGDPHVIVGGDICCSIFEKYGFQWGGYWSNPIDYQHFEKTLY